LKGEKMAGRYLVTGVQIGMLKADLSKEARDKVLDEILENQFIRNSHTSLDHDVKTLRVIEN
jgi:hypothetical protein